MIPVVSLFAALGLAAIHLVAGKLPFLEGLPRSRWLSAAGGVAVAYVFIHLLPELNARQRDLETTLGESLAFVEHHVYVVALAGLATFYGIERIAKRTPRPSSQGNGAGSSSGVFWLHMTSFGLYNLLIGYLLLHREEPGLANLLVFAVAMALHFVVADYGLREHHQADYECAGRWVLAAGLLLGWILGRTVTIRPAVLAVMVAFLAGAIILNVMKEELPAERQSRFLPFATGAIGYTALLLAI